MRRFSVERLEDRELPASFFDAISFQIGQLWGWFFSDQPGTYQVTAHYDTGTETGGGTVDVEIGE